MIIKKSSSIFAVLAMMVSSISAAPGVQAGAAKIDDDASLSFIDGTPGGKSSLRGHGCMDEDEDCLSISEYNVYHHLLLAYDVVCVILKKNDANLIPYPHSY